MSAHEDAEHTGRLGAASDDRASIVAVGVALAIAANLVISAGLNIQKWVHNDTERLPESERLPYAKRPLWWVGLSATVAGEVGNFLAFGFAGAAIVTPLGAVAVVSNAVIAAALLGERLGVRELVGVVLTVVGSVLVVIKAPTHDENLTVEQFLRLASGGVFVAYISLVCAAGVVLYWKMPVLKHRHPAWGLLLCSLLGTVTVLCATAVSNFIRLTASGDAQWAHPVPWVLALAMAPAAVGQVTYLNNTMELFDNTQVVPIYYILFTLSTVTGSAMLYQDFYQTPAHEALVFVCGCLLCFSGVGILSGGKRGPSAARAPTSVEELRPAAAWESLEGGAEGSFEAQPRNGVAALPVASMVIHQTPVQLEQVAIDAVPVANAVAPRSTREETDEDDEG